MTSHDNEHLLSCQQEGCVLLQLALEFVFLAHTHTQEGQQIKKGKLKQKIHGVLC